MKKERKVKENERNKINSCRECDGEDEKEKKKMRMRV
jgi:hypothetical protein